MINGSVGRSKYFSKLKKELKAEAAKHGIDTNSRKEMKKFENDKNHQFWLGITERLKCRCSNAEYQDKISKI